MSGASRAQQRMFGGCLSMMENRWAALLLIGACGSRIERCRVEGDHFWATADELKTGAEGIRLFDGREVVSSHGTWTKVAW